MAPVPSGSIKNAVFSSVAIAETWDPSPSWMTRARSEEHTSELQSPCNLVCRLLLEKKKLVLEGLKMQGPSVTARRTPSPHCAADRVGAEDALGHQVVALLHIRIFFFSLDGGPGRSPLFPRSPLFG